MDGSLPLNRHRVSVTSVTLFVGWTNKLRTEHPLVKSRDRVSWDDGSTTYSASSRQQVAAPRLTGELRPSIGPITCAFASGLGSRDHPTGTSTSRPPEGSTGAARDQIVMSAL
jgi:hypothetical protein